MRYSGKAILAIVALTVASPILSGETTSGSAANAVPAGTEALARIAELVPGLAESERDQLAEHGEVSNLYTAPSEPRLAPAFRNQIIEDLHRVEPRIGVEVLLLAPAPDVPSAGPIVFTKLQAMSTMAGIEYYSQTRDRMRILFHESYVIDDPEHRRRIPDPVWSIVPDRDRLYVFQRDSTFGKNVLQLDYRVDGEVIFLTMTNLTRMLFEGIIPAVNQEELIFHIIVQPVGDQMLFYGHGAARAPTLFGLKDRIQLSFYNRIVALYNWYTGQLARR
jgi:hypothetical protein